MKILHVWRDYTHNLFDHTNDLCNKNGINSKIACLNEVNRGDAGADISISSVYRLSPKIISSPSWVRRVVSKLSKVRKKNIWLKNVMNCCNEMLPDLLHFHFGFSFTELGYQKAWDKLPIIVSFYGVDAGAELLRKDVLREYQKLFFRKNFLFLCLSEQVVQRLVHIGCPKECIRIVDLPIDIDLIPILPFHDSPGKLNVLMAARFIEKKGHIYALKAVKHLLDKGHDISLTLFGYGSDGWLIELVDQFGLSESVTLINNNLSSDFIEQYVRHLRQSDVVIAPSVEAKNGDDEAGPALTVVMAQAAGKSVIVSNFTGHERSVTHMESGLVVPMRNEIELAKSIKLLLTDSALRRSVGERAASFVRKNFSKDTFLFNLRASYKELINE